MSRSYSRREEQANALTHGVGAVAGLGMLVWMASWVAGEGWLAWAAVGVYGLCAVGLFTASTAYHAVACPRWKARLQKVDHCAIYLLIAGTYTPFTLLVLGGGLGWALFSVVWALAAVGIALELVLWPRREALAVAFYLVMGWLVLLALSPLWAALSGLSLGLLLLGGLLYTGGVAFYVRDRRWDHTIWHGFVLGGAAAHALALSVFLA
jgi:hemolysin III